MDLLAEAMEQHPGMEQMAVTDLQLLESPPPD